MVLAVCLYVCSVHVNWHFRALILGTSFSGMRLSAPEENQERKQCRHGIETRTTGRRQSVDCACEESVGTTATALWEMMRVRQCDVCFSDEDRVCEQIVQNVQISMLCVLLFMTAGSLCQDVLQGAQWSAIKSCIPVCLWHVRKMYSMYCGLHTKNISLLGSCQCCRFYCIHCRKRETCTQIGQYWAGGKLSHSHDHKPWHLSFFTLFSERWKHCSYLHFFVCLWGVSSSSANLFLVAWSWTDIERCIC